MTLLCPHHPPGHRLRIDRVFRSTGLPAEVTGYHVRQPPRDLSDHAYGTYQISSHTTSTDTVSVIQKSGFTSGWTRPGGRELNISVPRMPAHSPHVGLAAPGA
ncbi:MAG: hypothetical protein ACRDRM_10185, partial [Pseudonocardiaceae bacterium]